MPPNIDIDRGARAVRKIVKKKKKRKRRAGAAAGDTTAELDETASALMS